jgi:hypothetical protein
MDGRGMRRAAVILAIVTGMAPSRSQAPNLAAMTGCWRTKDLAKPAILRWTTELFGETAAGECPLDVTDKWQVCLNEGDNQTLGGSATVFRSQNVKRIADPSASIMCTSLVATGYGQSFAVSGTVTGSSVQLSFAPENCMFGTCPKQGRQGTLSQGGASLALVLEDKVVMPLEKAQ